MQIKTIERCLRRLQIAEQNRTEQKTCRFKDTNGNGAHVGTKLTFGSSSAWSGVVDAL